MREELVRFSSPSNVRIASQAPAKDPLIATSPFKRLLNEVFSHAVSDRSVELIATICGIRY